MAEETKGPETVQNVQEENEANEGKPFKPRGEFVELRKLENGKWIWVLWSQNGRVMAVTGNSYSQRNDAQQGLETTLEILGDKNLRILVAAD